MGGGGATPDKDDPSRPRQHPKVWKTWKTPENGFVDVPDPTYYRVEDIQELRQLKQRLAKKGLSDPWLRNHVWRWTQDGFTYTKDYRTAMGSRRLGSLRYMVKYFTIGMPAALLLATVAVIGRNAFDAVRGVEPIPHRTTLGDALKYWMGFGAPHGHGHGHGDDH